MKTHLTGLARSIAAHQPEVASRSTPRVTTFAADAAQAKITNTAAPELKDPIGKLGGLLGVPETTTVAEMMDMAKDDSQADPKVRALISEMLAGFARGEKPEELLSHLQTFSATGLASNLTGLARAIAAHKAEVSARRR